MRQHLSRPLSNKSLKISKAISKSAWDEAISEAERQKEEAEREIRALNESITNFVQFRDTGASFPQIHTT